MYIKTKEGVAEKFPYTIKELRLENPNTSFPAIVNNDILDLFDVQIVIELEKPIVDRFYYVVKRDVPTLIAGQWVLGWDIVQKSTEAVHEETEHKAAEIRDSRNGKLTACDWTQLPDANVDKSMWADYRQALRDVTQQATFPWGVVWPERPNIKQQE
jgi:hypothetical protein